MKGVPATLSLVSFIDHALLLENTSLVKILVDAGAVIDVKTNVPRALMTAHTHSNTFGRILNPDNLSLGAGGSSGGEGALVALKRLTTWHRHRYCWLYSHTCLMLWHFAI